MYLDRDVVFLLYPYRKVKVNVQGVQTIFDVYIEFYFIIYMFFPNAIVKGSAISVL